MNPPAILTCKAAFTLPIMLRPQLPSSTFQSLARRAGSDVRLASAFRPRASHHVTVRPSLAMTGPSKPSAAPVAPLNPNPPPSYKITLLYDSECPLCVKEVNFLRGRVKAQGPPPSIKFVDIAASDYSPAHNASIDYETAMGRIHGILPDGNVLVGVPVFRAAYDAVGLGWVYAITKVPGVGAVADAVYNIWADFRLQLTGRPSLENIMQMRRSEAEKICRPKAE